MGVGREWKGQILEILQSGIRTQPTLTFGVREREKLQTAVYFPALVAKEDQDWEERE